MWETYDDAIYLSGDSLLELTDPIFDDKEAIARMVAKAHAQGEQFDDEDVLCFAAKQGAPLGKIEMALEKYLRSLNEVECAGPIEPLNFVGIVKVSLMPNGPVIVKRAFDVAQKKDENGRSLK